MHIAGFHGGNYCTKEDRTRLTWFQQRIAFPVLNDFRRNWKSAAAAAAAANGDDRDNDDDDDDNDDDSQTRSVILTHGYSAIRHLRLRFVILMIDTWRVKGCVVIIIIWRFTRDLISVPAPLDDYTAHILCSHYGFLLFH